jgi:hypothetical protein
MKQIIFLAVIAVMAMSIYSCGSRIAVDRSSQPSQISIKSDPPDVYTDKSFENMMKTPDYKPSVVVRNTVSGGSDANSARMVALFESGLTRNQFDVKDRGLFERVLKSYSENNQAINYVDLSEKTQTDLLFEITDYTIDDYYEVKTYLSGNREVPFVYRKPDASDPKGKRKILVYPIYEFRGMSIAIKVVVLKDNTIGGTYRYFYVPCSEEDGGCEILSFGGYDDRTRQSIPLKYRHGKNQPQDVNDIMGGNDGNSNSNRRTTRGERIDQAMANFITDNVIPSMLADMRGEEPKVKANPEITSNEITSPGQRASTSSARPGTSRNSYQIAQNISNLISQELMEQEAKNKKPKEGKTDEERLRNLKRQALTTVNQFITSSVTPVGSAPADSINRVIIFCESSGRLTNSLLCFVDGKCVGAGSYEKGIFTSFPKDQFESGFHTLSLRVYNGITYYECFNSKIDFSVKNKFLFELHRGGIRLTN